MRKLFTVVLFLFGLTAWSQNWEALKSSSKNFYSNGIHGSGIFLDFNFVEEKIDSVKIIGNDSILYPFRIINMTVGYLCGSLDTTSWLGDSILKSTDSTVFFNRIGEKLILKNPTKSSSWIFYTSVNKSSAVLSVQQFYMDSINGNLDSIALLKMNWIDSNGILITRPSSNDTILFSKTYGLLFQYEWNVFDEYNSTLFKRTPYSKLSVGQVYNFDVNDEFHFTTSYQSGPHSDHIRKITGKWYSSAQDTVFYIYDGTNISSNVDYSTNPPSIINHISHSVVTVSYTNLNRIINPGIIGSAIVKPNQSSLTGSFEPDISLFGGRNSEMELYNIGAYDTLTGCHTYVGHLGAPYVKKQYIEGCGMFESNYVLNGSPLNQNNFFKRLIFYKKGSITWGNPIIITGELENDIENSIELFPNPSNGKLTIKTEGLDEIIDIEVFDISGRLRKSISNFNSTEIDLGDLAKGMYFLKLKQLEITYTQKIILE